MSRWVEITKDGDQVQFDDGRAFEIGQNVRLGLGSIELRKTAKAGLHLARFSGRGNFTYALRLNRDGKYRIGAHRGHRVVSPSEETDPIKKILRELNIPVSILKPAAEPSLIVTERWYDNRHCPVGRGTSHWEHDGTESTISSEERETPHGYFQGGGENTISIERATYAICVSSGRYMNGSGWSRPSRIIVWPGCDPGKLAEALKEFRRQ